MHIYIHYFLRGCKIISTVISYSQDWPKEVSECCFGKHKEITFMSLEENYNNNRSSNEAKCI
jgi:hypothetical protein